MTFYLTFTAILCVFSVVATCKHPQTAGYCSIEKKSYFAANNAIKKFNVLSAVLLCFSWFLTAFRASEIGNDTQVYLDYFVRIRSTGVSGDYRIEYGFQFLCAIIGFFTADPQWLLIVCATICYLGVGVYIFKYSKNVFVSAVLIFCLCYSDFMNILRQDIAVIICLYAYQAIKSKKNICGIFLILLAFAFHKSALVALIFLLYRFFRFNLKIAVMCVVVLIGFSISGLANKAVLLFASQYAGYFESQYAGTGWAAVSMSVLKGLALIFFFNSAYKGSKKKHNEVLMCLTFYTIFSSMGYIVNLFTRAAQYFLLPVITEIPNACCDGQIKHKKLWLCVICFALLSYFIIVLLLRPEWNHLYPYRFFWN